MERDPRNSSRSLTRTDHHRHPQFRKVLPTIQRTTRSIFHRGDALFSPTYSPTTSFQLGSIQKIPSRSVASFGNRVVIIRPLISTSPHIEQPGLASDQHSSYHIGRPSLARVRAWPPHSISLSGTSLLDPTTDCTTAPCGRHLNRLHTAADFRYDDGHF